MSKEFDERCESMCDGLLEHLDHKFQDGERLPAVLFCIKKMAWWVTGDENIAKAVEALIDPLGSGTTIDASPTEG